jgi:hypothetical protein
MSLRAPPLPLAPDDHTGRAAVSVADLIGAGLVLPEAEQALPLSRGNSCHRPKSWSPGPKS